MKIKRLEIRGFKSFLERTVIRFPEGVSAIVGPNGCGKSNIVDAIRWTLGEQSAGRLRGRSMEDVIFGGANGHKPFGMAEVSLVFSNENGDLPAPYREYSEIMITRRLFRSGRSEYLLNKAPCRLKDIHELLWDTGLASRNYAVIEQGRVSAVVDMKPEERRGLIEEAAGISKYRNRKREALQKLDRAQQNLVRVSDILGEVQRQLNSLKRQAAKARRYRKLRERLRVLEISRAHAIYRELRDATAEMEKELGRLKSRLEDRTVHASALKSRLDRAVMEAREQADAIRKQERMLDRILQEVRQTERELEHREQRGEDLKKREEDYRNDLATCQARRYAMEEEIRKKTERLAELLREEKESTGGVAEKENALSRLTEEAARLKKSLEEEKKKLWKWTSQETDLRNRIGRIEDLQKQLAQRKGFLAREAEELARQYEAAEADLSDFLSRVDTLEEREARVREQREEGERQLKTHRTELARLEKRFREREKSVHEARSRLRTLKELWEKREHFDSGIRSLLQELRRTQAGANRSFRVVADLLGAVAPEYETALEVGLGPKLEALVVEDRDQAVEILRSHGERIKGRIWFFPLQSPHTPSSSAEEEDLPLLHRYVKVPASRNGMAQRLLGDLCVAPRLSDAIQLHDRTGLPVVTLQGEVVDQQGMLGTGTGGKGGTGILARKREIHELESKTRRLEEEWRQLRKETDAARARVGEARIRVEQSTKALEELRRRIMEVQQECYRIQEKRRLLDERLSVSESEAARLEKEMEEAARKSEEAARDLETVSQNRRLQEAKVSESADRHAALQEDLESLKETLYRHRIHAESLRGKRRQLESELEQGRRLLAETERQAGVLEHRLQECVSEQERLCEEEKALQEKRTQLKESSLVHGERIEQMQAVLEKIETEADELREQMDSLSEEIRGDERRIADLQLRATENQVEIRHVLQHIEQEYGVRLENRPCPEVEPVSPEEAFTEMEAVREKIRRMGEINAGAVEEYEALQQRFDFLTNQKKDLETSIREIHLAIQRLNRVCRNRLLETMERINEKLGEVFPALFGGGKAVVRLKDPSNALESGIEMEIHPPGKKVTFLDLLSGGEKALAALALLFSLSMIRPSPFYLMDEVDAPLDEANIDRFNRLLKKMADTSQVILVTHNRNTMEIADRLYGVTMEQPGISKLVSVNLKDLDTQESKQ